MEAPFIANRGEGWVESNPAPENSVLISITGSWRKAKIPRGYLDILRLGFDDYDPARRHPQGADLFTKTLAARTARFLRRHRGRNIVVHCAAGVSRSGAIAEAALRAFPEYSDRGWMRHPNGHVLALMLRALGLIPIDADPDS